MCRHEDHKRNMPILLIVQQPKIKVRDSNLRIEARKESPRLRIHPLYMVDIGGLVISFIICGEKVLLSSDHLNRKVKNPWDHHFVEITYLLMRGIFQHQEGG